jgi:4-hydroxyphenylacetate 3-monooxygenase
VDALPPVQAQLGELAAIASLVESMVHAQEALATTDADGVLWPGRTALYAVMALQSELNGRIMESLRELTGAAMITLPSSIDDYGNPEVAADMDRYVTSPGVDPRERVALMKLAWDVVGTEFAGRQQQYEKFYGGASFVCKTNMFRAYDFEGARALVEAALEESRRELRARAD